MGSIFRRIVIKLINPSSVASNGIQLQMRVSPQYLQDRGVGDGWEGHETVVVPRVFVKSIGKNRYARPG